MAQLLTGASVKTNAQGINRFAMKRPFAAVMIYIWCAAQKRPRQWLWGGGAAVFNRFATASS